MSLYNGISLLGMGGLLLLAWLLSSNRLHINGRAVAWGLGLQLFVALLVFQAPGSATVFRWLNDAALAVIDSGAEGQEFLFGRLAYAPGTSGSEGESLGFFFAFQVLPIIIFFAALMQLLYHAGVMQRIVRAFARAFTRLMRLSGAESLCSAANIFVGIESATAVRPYLRAMTRSELCLILTAGMATVASSVLAAYVQILRGDFPGIAGHLIAASLISAPAAIAVSKILLPEEERPATLGRDVSPHHERDPSALEALINGAGAGLQMVLHIAALLVAFLGLVALANLLVGGFGSLVSPLVGAGEVEWSLEALLGWLFTPLALLMGTPPADAPLVGLLLGERLILTEAVAYPSLAEALREGAFADPRSAVIAAYALCGFAHIASLAIFVGGIGALVPERRSDLVAVGPRALLGATLACLLTGAVAGVFAQ